MNLTREELQSPAHLKWVAHLTTRLTALREANDSLTSDENQTAVRRGQIREVKALLALANPAQEASGDGGETP